MDREKAKKILRRTGELISKMFHFLWMIIVISTEFAVITLLGIITFYGVYLIFTGEYLAILAVLWFGTGGILLINEEANLLSAW